MARRLRSQTPMPLQAPVVEGWVDPEQRHLRFAHLNGQMAETTGSVGSLVRAEFTLRCRQGPAWKRRLIAVLEEHAGPELLSHIEGMEVRKGLLRLEVAEPAVRYELGLRWEQRLLALLRVQLPAAGISAVRFVCRH